MVKEKKPLPSWCIFMKKRNFVLNSFTMRLIPFFSILAALLVLFACATEKGPSRPLGETHWIFTTVDGDTAGIGGITPRPYLLIRPGKEGLRFQVYGGCNNMLGHIETDSIAELRFSRIASTRKMCPKMTLEDRLQGILPMVDGYAIEGDVLKLMDGLELRAELKAGPEPIQ